MSLRDKRPKLYNDYGWAIIRQQPTAYITYFIWPNFLNFLYPQIELLENYDATNIDLPSYVKDWFEFDYSHLHCSVPNLQKWIIYFYPFISLLITLINWSAIFMVLKYRKHIDQDVRRLFVFWCFFYFGYMFFSICSTVVLLRYMDPYFVIGIIMPFVLLKKVADARGSEFSFFSLNIGS